VDEPPDPKDRSEEDDDGTEEQYPGERIVKRVFPHLLSICASISTIVVFLAVAVDGRGQGVGGRGGPITFMLRRTGLERAFEDEIVRLDGVIGIVLLFLPAESKDSSSSYRSGRPEYRPGF
jgi:hypothetical protein